MKKYFLITFGCQMNKSDSERIAVGLEEKGYKATLNINNADLILVNMCSVRQSAVDRVYGLVPKFQELKTKKPKLKTILTGCILKKDKKKLKQNFEIIGKEKYLECQSAKKKTIALVPISNGCNNFCSYCVVPYTRGRLVCLDHKKIMKEVQKAIRNGAKEIWLLGQNVNDYVSPSDQSVKFPDLVKKINEIPGNFQFFFTSPHPKNFSDELINLLAESEKFSRYLNLPVQSGDNTILKKMNRNYTAKQYRELVKKIRDKMPDINLSTDVIVGFPGETKKQFENTAKLFKDIKFNIAYIAKYSPRPNTASVKLKDNIPRAEKKRREKVLANLLLKNL